MGERYLYSGLIKLPVLHRASEEPLHGLAMIEELGRRGYKLSADTLYPILLGFEQRGYLVSSNKRTSSVERRVYKATRTERKALTEAKSKVKELFSDLCLRLVMIEHHDREAHCWSDVIRPSRAETPGL